MASDNKNRTKIILASILISVILLACLGFLGYFGVKTMRRTHLRAEARKAFAAEDWKKAEKLLTDYVGMDPDSEENSWYEFFSHKDYDVTVPVVGNHPQGLLELEGIRNIWIKHTKNAEFLEDAYHSMYPEE